MKIGDVVLHGEGGFTYEAALFFLCGHYAAEIVRERQRWAVDRGSTLSQEEIGRIFIDAANGMMARIDATSTPR